MSIEFLLNEFSTNRLGGEPLPDDLKILLKHSEELLGKAFLQLNGEKGWAPWLDTSYLSEKDREDPDIVANIQAINEVCGLIAFVGAYKYDQYFGYWRGPTNLMIADSPIVFFDNEGQFELVPGTNLAEAILWIVGEGEDFIELRDWMKSVGIDIRCESPYELTDPDDPNPPNQVHNDLFYRYQKKSSS